MLITTKKFLENLFNYHLFNTKGHLHIHFIYKISKVFFYFICGSKLGVSTLIIITVLDCCDFFGNYMTAFYALSPNYGSAYALLVIFTWNYLYKIFRSFYHINCY